MSLQVEALPHSAPSFRLARKVATSVQHIKRNPRSATRTTCRATDSASSQSSGAQSTLTLAMKEWAVTCGALGKGDQTVSRTATLWACCRLQIGRSVAPPDSLSSSHVWPRRLSCAKVASENQPSRQQLTPFSYSQPPFIVRLTC